jgi:hypothetical protein
MGSTQRRSTSGVLDRKELKTRSGGSPHGLSGWRWAGKSTLDISDEGLGNHSKSQERPWCEICAQYVTAVGELHGQPGFIAHGCHSPNFILVRPRRTTIFEPGK